MVIMVLIMAILVIMVIIMVLMAILGAILAASPRLGRAWQCILRLLRRRHGSSRRASAPQQGHGQHGAGASAADRGREASGVDGRAHSPGPAHPTPTVRCGARWNPKLAELRAWATLLSRASSHASGIEDPAPPGGMRGSALLVGARGAGPDTLAAAATGRAERVGRDHSSINSLVS